MAGVGGHLGKSEAKEKGWMRASTIRTEGKIAAPWQLSLHGKWGSWLNKNICWIRNGNDQTTSGERCMPQQRPKQNFCDNQSWSTAGFTRWNESSFTTMSFHISSCLKNNSSASCLLHNKILSAAFHLGSVQSRGTWREWLSDVTCGSFCFRAPTWIHNQKHHSLDSTQEASDSPLWNFWARKKDW